MGIFQATWKTLNGEASSQQQLWRKGDKRLGWSLGEMRYIEGRSSWDGVHVCTHTLNHTRSPTWTFLFRLTLQCSVFSCPRILQKAKRSKKRFCPSSLVSLNHMISLSDAIAPLVLMITLVPSDFIHYPLILYATSNSGIKICSATY